MAVVLRFSTPPCVPSQAALIKLIFPSPDEIIEIISEISPRCEIIDVDWTMRDGGQARENLVSFSR